MGYMLDRHFVLDGKIPRETTDAEWGQWFHRADRKVAYDVVGNVSISTIFLGVDTDYGGGEPLIFETAICSDQGTRYVRSATWDEAERQHAELVRLHSAP